MSVIKPNCCYTCKTIFSKLSCKKYPKNVNLGKNNGFINHSLKLLSYNTQCIIGKVSKEKINLIIRSLSDDYDILCLQEVFIEDTRKKFLKKLKKKYPYYISKLGNDKFTVHKIVIESHPFVRRTAFYMFSSMQI